MSAQNSDSDGMDYRKEVDRLYALEYGRRVDTAFRFLLLLAGGVSLFLYTDRTLTLWWVGAQGLLHLVHFLHLRSRSAHCGYHDVLIAGITFSVMIGAFLWLPAWMIVQHDPALRIAGAAGIGALLVFLIHRADRLLEMMLGEIFVVGLVMGWIVLQTLTQIANPVAQIGVAISAGGLWIFFALTMVTARRIRIDAERAAQRSIQAQKMEAIGQLAGGVAHDFNNILTAVIGNLDLYENIEDPTERDALVREAHVAAHRAADLVQQLLAYARRSPMQLARRDVGALLEQLQVLTRRLLPATIVQSFEAPRDPLWVALDESQFLTAMVNLVVNARDAMPDGGALRVTTRPVNLFTDDLQPDGSVLPAGAYAEVTVADTGTGIPPEILRRVTEPFFTTKAVGQGSGLGLSMVEGFVRQSGGTLTIGSSDEGTVMRLLLPIAPRAEGQDETAAASNAPLSQPRPQTTLPPTPFPPGLLSGETVPARSPRRGPLRQNG